MEYDEDDYKLLDRLMGEQRHMQTRQTPSNPYPGRPQGEQREENKYNTHQTGHNNSN
jgi:hypothetical protein